jgi:drug/metabolite transporter (DMT)-like permease
MWFAFALIASVLWGVQYALSGRMLQTLSPAGLMVVLSACQLLLFGGVVLVGGDLRQFEPRSLASQGWMLLAVVVVSAAANWCIGASIQGKNATVAGLVEMTYPLFTALFAYLAFRETHLSPTTLAGGLVILAGMGIVVAGSR